MKISIIKKQIKIEYYINNLNYIIYFYISKFNVIYYKANYFI